MSAFGYRKPSDLPQSIPLFPLEGAILLPRGVLALNVFEPRYLNMVDDALGAERLIGMIQPAADEAGNPDLADVGTVGRITSFSETEDGRYLITLTGVARFDLVRELEPDTPYRQALVDYEPFTGDFTPAMTHAIDRITGVTAKLLDFQVHSVSVGQEAQGEVDVKVEIDGVVIHGRGVSTDIIEASAKAYLSAICRATARSKDQPAADIVRPGHIAPKPAGTP